jgi:hypothetical protein
MGVTFNDSLMAVTISLNYWSGNIARRNLAKLMPYSHAVEQRKNSFLLRNSKYNENEMRRQGPRLQKTARIDRPTSKAQFEGKEYRI